MRKKLTLLRKPPSGGDVSLVKQEIKEKNVDEDDDDAEEGKRE